MKASTLIPIVRFEIRRVLTLPASVFCLLLVMAVFVFLGRFEPEQQGLVRRSIMRVHNSLPEVTLLSFGLSVLGLTARWSTEALNFALSRPIGRVQQVNARTLMALLIVVTLVLAWWLIVLGRFPGLLTLSTPDLLMVSSTMTALSAGFGLSVLAAFLFALAWEPPGWTRLLCIPLTVGCLYWGLQVEPIHGLGQHGYKFSRNWYWGVAKPIVSLSIVCVGFYALSLWRWTRGDL